VTASPPECSTTEPRPGFALDPERLDAYLREHVQGYRGPLSVRQFKGGQSNPTYLLITPQQRYVLRRKPPGQLLASAHAVEREYRVISALATHTEVAVPRTHALCTLDSVIGTSFYVMEYVAGRIFWDPSLPEIPRALRAQYFQAQSAAIACLHRVDPAAVGLADFGKASGYLERQIARWSQQYRADEAAGRVGAMDRLIEWLPQHLPAPQPPAIVHGDFRIDNLIFHPTEPRVLAILDWELSTLGDPLADFAYHLMMYRMPTLAIAGLLGKDLPALGIPSEEEYAAAYCAPTGRRDSASLDFYLAFCLFRLAGILHGIRGRVIRGTAVSATARGHAQNVEAVAELAWQQAERAMCSRRETHDG